MSLLKALRESCQKIETATTSWNQNLFSNLAKLREEGIATDVEVVVFDKKGLVSPPPILAHSLVLAAISPALASILASSGDASEGFTLIFPEGDRGVVEDAIKDLYSGQKGGIAFLQSWGLLRGEGGGGEKVFKEETHSDEDEDDYVQDNFDLHGETGGREDNNDEIPLQHPAAKQIMDRVKRSNRTLCRYLMRKRKMKTIGMEVKTWARNPQRILTQRQTFKMMRIGNLKKCLNICRDLPILSKLIKTLIILKQRMRWI